MSLRVLSPGMLSTVQDGGRQGWRRYGIGQAGALDPFSLAVGNMLVGNRTDAPALEITLSGPRLHFDHPARIALTGAEIDAEADGQALPGWRPIDLPAGCELRLGACRRGSRAYLCLAGGLAMPSMLGSASTDLRGGFGGMRGRMLAAGDLLPLSRNHTPECRGIEIANWWIDPTPDLDFNRSTLIHVLTGGDACAPADALYEAGWAVAADSNRQALRLAGPKLAVAEFAERISEPVLPGTVQLPPDGQPIVLLADAQTVGGYPRIGHAITADWQRLAQLRPGESLHFAPCSVEQAWRLRCQQRARLARIGYAIERRMR